MITAKLLPPIAKGAAEILASGYLADEQQANIWSQALLWDLYVLEVAASHYNASSIDENGMVIVGAARGLLRDAPEQFKVAYERAHELAEALTLALPVDDPVELPDRAVLGAAPVAAIVIGVVGVAAVIATAWYFHSATKIRASAAKETELARIGKAAEVAGAELAATGSISPSTLSLLHSVAPTTLAHASDATTWLAVGAAAGVAAMYLLTRAPRGARR